MAAELSYAQEGLWFMERALGSGRAFTMDRTLLLRGPVDVPALRRAFAAVSERHDVLRTAFPVVDGRPVQVVRPELVARLGVEELPSRAEAEALAAGEGDVPFDLATVPPLRARLLRVGRDEHLLVVALHHIVSDGWSWHVLLDDLSAFYDAFRAGRARAPEEVPLRSADRTGAERAAALEPLRLKYADYAAAERAAGLEPLPLQYADYAAAQRAAPLQPAIDYWRGRLAGAPAGLGLATDRPRAGAGAGEAGFVRVALDRSLVGRLEALGHEHGANLFVAALAAWSVVLARHARTADVVVGTPAALDRARPELERLVGLFVNMLPLRLEAAPARSFRSLLDATRDAVFEAYAHHELPFARLVQEVAPRRDRAHAPLFETTFDVRHDDATPLRLGEAEAVQLDLGRPTAQHDLMLSLEVGDGRAATAWAFDAALFDAETVAELGRQLAAVIAEAVARPDVPVGELGGAEGSVRLAGERAPPGERVDERFAAVVRRAPEAVAVVDGRGAMTYAQLDRRSSEVAAALARRVPRGGLVGLRMPRSAELVVAMLGVVRAGCAYVPLDPDQPEARLAELVRKAAPEVVLTGLDGAGGTAPPPLGSADERGGGGPAPAPSPSLPRGSPDELAYVIHTSGSTGRPNGVCVTHRGVAALTAPGWHGVGPGDRVAQLAGSGFDASALEVWVALLNGAELHVAARDDVLDPRRLAAFVSERSITVLHLAAPLLNDAAYRAALAPLPLRTLLFGGDTVHAGAVAELRAAGFGGRLLHCYGPTETTVLASVAPIEDVADPRRRLPIGGPLPGGELYVLDERLEPVAPCVPGELCVGGAGLARGYLGDPALTARRFAPNPVRPGERLYRTGDLARRLPGGGLELLGRADRQVKVRGVRVEPAEVEAVLAGLPGVAEAAVCADRDARGDARLVAYVAPPTLDPRALRTALRERLADQLVPAAIVPVDRLPLTANGKVDRDALAALAGAGGGDGDGAAGGEGDGAVRRGAAGGNADGAVRRGADGRDGAGMPRRGAAGGDAGAAMDGDGAGTAPRGPTEHAVATAFADLLDLPTVGPGDDFFDLGGHSLLVVQLLSRLRDATGVEVPIGAVFAAPTVAGVAAALDEARAEATAAARATEPRLVALNDSGTPPTFVLFHSLGGGLVPLRPLAAALGDAHPVLGFDGAIEGREELSELAERYAAELAGRAGPPAILAGWSVGGTLAHEVARRWAERDGTVATVVLIDAPRPSGRHLDDPHLLRAFAHALAMNAGLPSLKNLDDAAFTLPRDAALDRLAGALAAATGVDRARLDDLADHFDAFAEGTRAHERHEPRRHPGPAIVVRERGGAKLEDAWRDLCAGVTAYEVPADHYGLLREPAVHAVAGVLRASAAGAPERPPRRRAFGALIGG
ncbi:MAG TPA: amino acid adenylation domain-containing protein [Solirubrobacteraceae bacterium]|jgi:amino acid adenylation domain-containing protein|nr:amino acid adenylation domain-containing protein [Solirubrobacteraceae bacterium]